MSDRTHKDSRRRRDSVDDDKTSRRVTTLLVGLVIGLRVGAYVAPSTRTLMVHSWTDEEVRC